MFLIDEQRIELWVVTDTSNNSLTVKKHLYDDNADCCYDIITFIIDDEYLQYEDIVKKYFTFSRKHFNKFKLPVTGKVISGDLYYRASTPLRGYVLYSKDQKIGRRSIIMNTDAKKGCILKESYILIDWGKNFSKEQPKVRPGDVTKFKNAVRKWKINLFKKLPK